MHSLGISQAQAQRLIDRGRLFCDGRLVRAKGEILRGKIELISYQPRPRGLDLIFENQHFAAVEKPSGVLSHPNGRHCPYSLADELWALWGPSATVAHRLDRQTSGILLVAKTRPAQIELKGLFARGAVKKEYLALVRGRVSGKVGGKFIIDHPLERDEFKTRMRVAAPGGESGGGLRAKSEFRILSFLGPGEGLREEATLLLCQPLTGRQHQLRVHLHQAGHTVLGDPLYGLAEEAVERMLDGVMSEEERLELTGGRRLCLHASRLSFDFGGEGFTLASRVDALGEFTLAAAAGNKRPEPPNTPKWPR